MKHRIAISVLAGLMMAGLVWGLTVNGSLDVLGTLTASVVNFGSSASTQPNKTGTVAPATCAVGQTFFKSDASAGSNLMLCAAVNTWSTIAGGSTFDAADASVSWFREEFITGGSSIGSATGTGLIRTVGFGSGDLRFTTSDAGHPGVLDLNSNAALGSGGWIGAAVSGSNGSTKVFKWVDLYAKDWEVLWIAKLSSTADVRFRAGLDSYMGVAGSPGSGSMWIRYDTSTAYDDDTKNGAAGSFVAQICGYDDANCASSGSGLTAVFNIAADTSWHRFRVYRTSGKINFQIDANPPKTACLAGGGCDMTLPPNPGYGLSSYNTTAAIIFANDVAAAKTVSVDFLGIKLTGLTR